MNAFPCQLVDRCQLGQLRAIIAVMLILLPSLFSTQIASGQAIEQLTPDGWRDPGRLVSEVEAGGEVGVIVELAMTYRPEAQLQTEADRRQQRATIAQTQEQVLAALAGTESRVTATWQTIPFMGVRVDRAGLKALQQSPHVAGIQEDALSEPLLGSSTVHVNAPNAWNLGFEGSDQTIVIIDSGIDAAHPFFGGRVVDAACFSNANNNGAYTSLCPNGGGREFGTSAASATIPACSPEVEPGTIYPLCWHGTHVAGVASGADPGGLGFNGVARGSNIIAIQVFTRIDSESVCGVGRAPCILSYTSDQLNALDYVYTTLSAQHEIAAVNLSLGGGSYSDQAQCDGVNGAMKAAIDNLRSLEIATVAAGGNSGTRNAIAAPACISSAVAVSASTDPTDTIAGFSSLHDMVELLAPGSGITSAMPRGDYFTDDYFTSNGTSFAAPHVAGAFAILRQQQPDASIDEVLALLQSTGVPITDTRTGGTVTKPRIDLAAAVRASIELTGAYTLEGRTDQTADLRVEFYEVGAAAPSYSFTPIGNSNGEFAVRGMDPGVYEVAVKAGNTLQRVQEVTIQPDGNYADFGTLPGGDANDDNRISTADVSIVSNSFNLAAGDVGYDGRADFNGDGRISTADISMLSNNYNQIGEAPSGAP